MEDYVLIIDDDPDAREVLSRIAATLQLSSRDACNGLEALEIIHNSGAPRLVLLDLMMPHMDGFTVLSRLRAQPSTRCTQVIVVTAYRPGQVDMLKLPGVTEVVHKGTYTIPDMRELISSTLNLAITHVSTPNKPTNFMP